MAKQKYTQCSLVKKTGTDSTSNMVSFIPTELAIAGYHLSLKNMKGDWEDGWLVESTGVTLQEEQLQIYRDVYRHTRNASDA